MQDRVIELRLPNGSSALARVRQLEGGGAMKTSALTAFDLEDIRGAIEGLAEAAHSAVAKAAPDKVTVELGLELAVKNGKLTGLLVEGEGKGSLGITLEWDRSGDER